MSEQEAKPEKCPECGALDSIIAEEQDEHPYCHNCGYYPCATAGGSYATLPICSSAGCSRELRSTQRFDVTVEIDECCGAPKARQFRSCETGEVAFIERGPCSDFEDVDGDGICVWCSHKQDCHAHSAGVQHEDRIV